MIGRHRNKKCLIMSMPLILLRGDYKEKSRKKIYKKKICILLKESFKSRPSHILLTCMRLCQLREVGKERREIIQFSCLLFQKLSQIDLFLLQFSWTFHITKMYTNSNFKPYTSNVSLTKSRSTDNFYRRAAERSLKQHPAPNGVESDCLACKHER